MPVRETQDDAGRAEAGRQLGRLMVTTNPDSPTAASPVAFAFHAHRDQKRKYTGEPYTGHLAEVAGLTAAVAFRPAFGGDPETAITVAWLHDCVEDTDVTFEDLEARFGRAVREGVAWLSDLDKGNRATRKRLSRERLAKAPDWVQTIKVADIISNTSSIRQHDPGFAPIDQREKTELLDVLTGADAELVAQARRLLA